MKIGIIEDEVYDITRRYGCLAKYQHEVYLIIDVDVLEPWMGKEEINLRKITYNRILCEESGFKPENIIYGLDDIPLADIYFCDGLKGRCFEIADRLGREKVYINTTDYGIGRLAKQKGYRIIRESVEDIVEDLRGEK